MGGVCGIGEGGGARKALALPELVQFAILLKCNNLLWTSERLWTKSIAVNYDPLA